MACVTSAFAFGGYASPPDDEPLWPYPSPASAAHHPPPFDVSEYFLDGAAQSLALRDAVKLAAPAWPLDEPAAPLPDRNAPSAFSLKLSHVDPPSLGPLPGHRSSSSSSQSSANGSSSWGVPSSDPSPKSTTGPVSAELTPPVTAHSLAMSYSPFGTDPLGMTNSAAPATAAFFTSSPYVSDTTRPPDALSTAPTLPAYPFMTTSLPLHKPNEVTAPQSNTFATNTITQSTAYVNSAAHMPTVMIPDLGFRVANPQADSIGLHADPGPAPNQRYRLVQPEGELPSGFASTSTNIASNHDTFVPKDEIAGHNAVEKRYRNNINNNIAALADLVPALSHLRALPSAATSRRHSSQFIVASSAIGKIPMGLVDGVKAAQKLSKGSILGKSVDYIRHLRRSRDEMNEDVEELKFMVTSMVEGGGTIIKQWEERVRSKAPAREKIRLAEQQAGAEDADDDDDDGGGMSKPSASKKRKASDPKPSVGKVGAFQKRHSIGVHQQSPSISSRGHINHNQPAGSGVGDLLLGLDFDPTQFASLQSIPSVGGFMPMVNGPSPGSSSSHGGTPPSAPAYVPQAAQRRQLLAAFMGLTFATGTSLHFRSRQTHNARQSSNFTGPFTSFDHPQVHQLHVGYVQMGFNIVGIISIVLLGILLARPSLLLHQRRVVGFSKKSKSAVSRRRPFKVFERAAEARLGCEDDFVTDTQEVFSMHDSLVSAAAARQRLMKLAGGPEGALGESISLAREVIMALYREAKATWPLSGSNILAGGDQSSIEATEKALTWLRIAEIETILAPSQTSAVSRLHTALRLYNLSRSAEWPQNTSSPAETSFPKVNAVLSLHLRTLLGDTNSLSEALWQQAMNRKESSDGSLEPWLGEALSANFEEACRILDQEVIVNGVSAPSDTLPLLKIAEVRSEEALRELWSRIWVQTIKRTCPLANDVPLDIKLGSLEHLRTQIEETSDGLALQVAAARAVMEEAVNHIFSSSLPGSTIRTLACVTKGVWALGFGNPEVTYTSANILARESTAGGPASRLACVAAFMEFVVSKRKADIILGQDQVRTPLTAVDKLATATITWLSLRRRHFIIQSSCEGGFEDSNKLSLVARDAEDLQRSATRLKHLLMDEVFASEDIIHSSIKQTREAIQAGEAKEYDLSDAVNDCLEGIEEIAKRTARIGVGLPTTTTAATTTNETTSK